GRWAARVFALSGPSASDVPTRRPRCQLPPPALAVRARRGRAPTPRPPGVAAGADAARSGD
nr:hypothetical protein [Tanacetum cinerariifolium]